jgi:VanZ family protein
MLNWFINPSVRATRIWIVAEITLIFILLSIPGDRLPSQDHWWKDLPIDKLVHMILFGILAFAFFANFKASNKPTLQGDRPKALALIFCLLLGIGMEYYQKYFVPSRGFEVADMLADTFGAILALPIFNFIHRNKK